jgi:hypothetical protein
MRLTALLLALLTSSLLAADEPKTEAPKSDAPAKKPAVEPAPKAKKRMGIPEIPEGVSISDGVKLQAAWVKVQEDPDFKAANGKDQEEDKKKKKDKAGAKEAKGGRAAADEALAKAMIKADPSLKPELVRTYLAAAHAKAGDKMKKKDK